MSTPAPTSFATPLEPHAAATSTSPSGATATRFPRRRRSVEFVVTTRPSVYLMSVSILNIGRYIAITIVPTMIPTKIIRIGSMIDVSDWMLESTSSS